MPVLSEPCSQETGLRGTSTPTVTYIYLGAAFILCVGTLVTRRARTRAIPRHPSPPAEKEPLRLVDEKSESSYDFQEREPQISHTALPLHLSLPEHPQRFIPEQPPPSALSAQRASTLPSNRPSTLSISHQHQYQSPSYLSMDFPPSPVSADFISIVPDPFFTSQLTNQNPSYASLEFPPTGLETELPMPPPRRRSYTKTTPDGRQMTGEIVEAEGWRRHTRVWGGGVCKACEEGRRGSA